MKQMQISIPVAVMTFDELNDDDRALVSAARQATYRSYVPYSHFSVGAAIRLDNGETVTGANQENAAYPSGTCAERTTCYYAHATYPEARFETIAIAARGVDGEFVSDPVSPCGACRQALLEYETLGGRNVRVILVGADHVYVINSVAEMLPFAFTKFRD